MNYHNWEELAVEILQCKSVDTRLHDAQIRLVDLFNSINMTPVKEKKQKEVRDWVKCFYDKYGKSHPEYRIYKALIETKDNHAYCRALKLLLPIMY
jgi:hypothetical protein